MADNDNTYTWTGGDVVRGEYPPERQEWLDAPANEGVPWDPPSGAYGDSLGTQYPGFLRFPKPEQQLVSTTDVFFQADAQPHREDGLGSLYLRWGLSEADTANFTVLCITRSGFGFPQTPNDGTKVIYRRRNEVNPVYNGDTGLDLWSTIDENLQPGRWYYYSLFVKTNPYDWQLVKRTHCLVPVDYGHAQKLWDTLPPYYQWVDDETWAGTNNSTLRRFYEVLGYGLDFIRTEAEGVERTYSADSAPMQLYRALGEQNNGISSATALGDVRFRRLTARINHLNRLRGTLAGLEEFVTTATQYVTTVTPGRNEMLVSDDAEFVALPGHWGTLPATLGKSLALLHDPGDGLDFVRTQDTVLSTTSEIDPPVDRSADPEIKLGRGVLKISPRWATEASIPGGPLHSLDTWHRTGVSDATATSRLAISCGVGTRLRQYDVDKFRKIEQSPTLYGIPVEDDHRYYFSFYMARSGYREDRETGERIEVTPDISTVRFGLAWYHRNSVKGNEAFSDGFSSGFQGYRTVEPLDVTVSTHTPTEPWGAEEWEYVIGTFEAPAGAEFACPIIEFEGVDISARFIAAAMVSQENLAGRVVAFDADLFILLGDPEDEDDETNRLGTEVKVLGDAAELSD